MQNYHDIIFGLTTEARTVDDKSTLLGKFAREFGWNPSYHLSPSDESINVNIHLVVEHGLENSAIITFLRTPYAELTESSRNALLNISYNNLVDWHIHIESNKITYVYNRISPSRNVIAEYSFRRDEYEQLRSDAFDKIIGRKPNPNIPPLDDALINTISNWKRAISSELQDEDINEPLSNLFNAIIFIRAIEDNRKRQPNKASVEKILPKAWQELEKVEGSTIEDIFLLALSYLGEYSVPSYLIDFSKFNKLNSLNKQSIAYLFDDFYRNKHTSLYQYDFSIISMHALSRIYERYIAILKVEEDNQLSIFPSFKNLAKEDINRAFGSIFTPQYIARFFAQYLKENMTPAEFNRTKVAEPAVGSGIFLRSILEIKCDPRGYYSLSNFEIEEAFKGVFGIDIDTNATKATELSLALLQLVLTNKFPDKLNIINDETINYINNNKALLGSFDAVLSNPPFISTDTQTASMRKVISEYMGDLYAGKMDSFYAFLKVGVDLLKPGGYGMFVLPHSFMVSSSGSKVRQFLSDTCWIRCVVDLSAIPVFGNTGIYVVLLIFQKRSDVHFLIPPVTVVNCKDYVGKALQAALKNVSIETDFYSVYEINQSDLQSKQWYVLPAKEISLQRKISNKVPLSEFLDIKQGFVSGNDKVFIVNKEAILESESELYVPYLQDRSIDSYNFDYETNLYFLNQFYKNQKITEEDLKNKFPGTWEYLLTKKSELISKKIFDNEFWFRPMRPRNPKDLLRPKIVTPHLTITPKFAIDLSGKYAVSRSPYLVLKNVDVKEDDLLLYFLGILNSTPCYWYISSHSHKYSKGYNMLEVKTLNETPVPDPSFISASIMKRFLSLVKRRIALKPYQSVEIDLEIDKLSADMYGLSYSDMNVLGIF